MKRLYGEGPNPSGLCQCGCGQPAPIAPSSHSQKGYIKGKPRRFISGHNACRTRPFSIARYVVDPETGCHIWQGAKKGAGYGNLSHGGKWVGAHRLAYEEKYGPLPDGFVPDHLCENKACINPEHMVAATLAENSRRGPHVKLNWNLVGRIRELAARGRSLKSLAEEFGVSDSCVGDVVNFKRWVR